MTLRWLAWSARLFAELPSAVALGRLSPLLTLSVSTVQGEKKPVVFAAHVNRGRFFAHEEIAQRLCASNALISLRNTKTGEAFLCSGTRSGLACEEYLLSWVSDPRQRCMLLARFQRIRGGSECATTQTLLTFGSSKERFNIMHSDGFQTPPSRSGPQPITSPDPCNWMQRHARSTTLIVPPNLKQEHSEALPAIIARRQHSAHQRKCPPPLSASRNKFQSIR